MRAGVSAVTSLQRWRKKAQQNIQEQEKKKTANDFNDDNAFVRKQREIEERNASGSAAASPSAAAKSSSMRAGGGGGGSVSPQKSPRLTAINNNNSIVPNIDVTAASPRSKHQNNLERSLSNSHHHHKHPHHHSSTAAASTSNNNLGNMNNASPGSGILDPSDIYSATGSSQRTSRSRSARSSVAIEKARKRQVIRAMNEEGNIGEKLADDELDQLPTSLYVFSGSNPLRLFMLQAMQNWWFQQFILLCILFNAVLLGVDQPINSYPEEVITFLYVADFTFSVIFAIEMVIKIIALGFIAHEGAYLRGGWNILDFVIVVTSIVNLASDATNLSALRVVRVLRPLRSVSRIPELRILIQSLLKALPQVVDNILLFFLFLVIFAVVGLQIWPGKLTHVCYANFRNNSEFYKQVYDNKTRVFPERRCGGDFSCTSQRIENASVRCEADEGVFYPSFRNFDNFGNAALFVFKLMVLDNWTDDINNMMDSIGADVIIYFLFLTILGFYCAYNLFFAVLSNAYSSAADNGGVNTDDSDDLDKNNRDAATWIDVTKLDPHLILNAKMKELEEQDYDENGRNACNELCCVFCGGIPEEDEEEQQKQNAEGNDENNNNNNNNRNNNNNEVEMTENKKNSPTTALPHSNSATSVLPVMKEEDLLASAAVGENENENNINNNNEADADADDCDDEMPTLIAPNLTTLISLNIIELSDEAFGCVDNIPLDLTVKEAAGHCENVIQTQREEFDRVREEQEEVRNTTANSLFSFPRSFRTNAKDDRHIFRCFIGWIVGHRIAELVMLVVTMLNTIALAIDHYDIDKALLFRLDIISLICTIIFTIEIVLKLIAFGPFETLSSPFNALDFIIVLESLIQYIISGSIESSGLAALRVLRTLRVLKLLTMFPSLQLIVRGVLHSMDSIGYLSLLILLHLYVFAILGMQLFGTNYKEKNPDEFLGFGTTYESFLISFVVLTGDSWTDRMRAAMLAESQSTVWIPVIFFILLFFIGNFVLVNLMVAIILDHMQELLDGLEQARSVDTHPPMLILPPAFLIPQPRSQMMMMYAFGKKSRSQKNLWSALTVDKQTGAIGVNANADAFESFMGKSSVNLGDSSMVLMNKPSSTNDLSEQQQNQNQNQQQQQNSLAIDITGVANSLSSGDFAAGGGSNNISQNQQLNVSSTTTEERNVNNNNIKNSHSSGGSGSHQQTPPAQQSLVQSPTNAAKKEKKEPTTYTSAAIRNLRIDSVELEDTDFYDKMDADVWSKLWMYTVALFEPEEIRATRELSLGIFSVDNCVRATCLYLHKLPLYNLLIFLAVIINVIFLFIDNPFLDEELTLAVFVADIVVAVIFFFDMITKIIAFGLYSPNAVDVATEKEMFAHENSTSPSAQQSGVFGESPSSNGGGGGAFGGVVGSNAIAAEQSHLTNNFHASMPGAFAQIEEQEQRHEQAVGAYLTDFWNIVDGVVTIFSVVGLFVEDTKFFKAFRTFRLLARIEGARIILEAVMASLPMVLNGLFLTVLAFMTFGVLGVQLYKGAFYTCTDDSVTIRANCTGTFLATVTDPKTGLERQEQAQREWVNAPYHFDDFPNSILTLFLVVAGDSWATVMYTGMNVVGENIALRDKASPENALFFVAAYVVGNIFCLNMIIGILLNFFQRQKEIQDGSAFLTEKQRKFLRARNSIEQTWVPQDEDVLFPMDNAFSRTMHRVLTYMWFEAKEDCCCCFLPSNNNDNNENNENVGQELHQKNSELSNNSTRNNDPGSPVVETLAKKQSSRGAMSRKRSSKRRSSRSFPGHGSGSNNNSGSNQKNSQQNPLAGDPSVDNNNNNNDDANDSQNNNNNNLQAASSASFGPFHQGHHSSVNVSHNSNDDEGSGLMNELFDLDKNRSVMNTEDMFGGMKSPEEEKHEQKLHEDIDREDMRRRKSGSSRQASSAGGSRNSRMIEHGEANPEEDEEDSDTRIQTTIAQTFFYVVITLNFIINAIEYNEMPASYANTLVSIEIGCLVVFTVEWIMKVSAYGMQLVTSSTTVIGWFAFDTIIIIFGFVSIAQPELRFLSFLRALRLMKLLRGTGVEKLLLMLIRSFRQIVNVFIVLLLSYFVFAVAGVAFFAQAQVDPNSFFINENRNFKNVPRALLILFQASTTDGWGDFADTLASKEFCKPQFCIDRALANGFFIVFLCIITWIGLQMFVAILIEVFDNFRNDLEDDDPMKIAFFELRAKYDMLYGEGAPDVPVYDFIDNLHELPFQLTQFTSMEPGPNERLKLLGTLPIAVKSDMTISFRDIVLAFAFKHFQIDVRSSSDFLTDVFRGTVFGLAFSVFQVQAVRIIQSQWQIKKKNKEQQEQEQNNNNSNNNRSSTSESDDQK